MGTPGLGLAILIQKDFFGLNRIEVKEHRKQNTKTNSQGTQSSSLITNKGKEAAWLWAIKFSLRKAWGELLVIYYKHNLLQYIFTLLMVFPPSNQKKNKKTKIITTNKWGRGIISSSPCEAMRWIEVQLSHKTFDFIHSY